MDYNIEVKKNGNSRLDKLDFNNIPLGRTFTDHMFVCDYENGNWVNPRIEPLGLIPTHPAAMALHYGQAIFEGMKATKDQNDTPLLFRPELNAQRLNKSADRMGMPNFPEELFIEGLKRLVALDENWIPPQDGSALYLRPFMYADEPFIGMRAATHFKFIIIASPSGPLFTRPIKLYAETKYIRAMEGGTGEAKAAGNYAAAIRPTEIAKAKGYDQVLWLDAVKHEYIQEVGTMNLFFHIDNEIITPSLDGAILNGITRRSVIEILNDKGYKVVERPISIKEIFTAQDNNTLKEAFGTGTAVNITKVGEISHNDKTIHFSDHHPIADEVLKTLNGLKNGSIKDRFNWIVKVEKSDILNSHLTH
ncbi:MAG: branched-chain amino acid aminotransferase [Flavobacteriaceae bacterium]|nr:branched-chain amino acid aminotransferase [Flavobacteriaceae bacterium]